MTFIDKPLSVLDQEGSSPGCGRLWESGGDTMDPELGQESSHCQPLIRIIINQETIEQPGPEIE